MRKQRILEALQQLAPPGAATFLGRFPVVITLPDLEPRPRTERLVRVIRGEA